MKFGDGSSIILTISLASILVLSGSSVIFSENAYAGAATETICNDGIDNDLDGFIDLADPDCPIPPTPDSDAMTPFLGDFRCYDVTDHNVFIDNILLTDQFRQLSFDLVDIIKICTMVNKASGTDPDTYPGSAARGLFSNDVDPLASDQHFVVYRVCDAASSDTNCIPATPVNIDVQLTDQFGPYEDQVERPIELWVPAGKDNEGDDFPQSDFNDIHYLCYNLDAVGFNPSPFNVPITVTLVDQFLAGTEQISVVGKMCNPVLKTVPGGPQFGALNVEHLKCYDLPNTVKTSDPLFFDQFFPDGVELFLQNTEDLCLAADKSCQAGTPGRLPDCDIPLIAGSLTPMDTTMVLLAGTQVMLSWIIPVVVAAVGFGVVIARKY